MAFDFENTITLLAAIKNTKKPTTFLRDRYCPRGITFSTKKVLVQFKDGERKLAPMVHKRMGSVQVGRPGWLAEEYEPPYFAPHRTITLDALEHKQFGEALYSDRTPEQRARILLMEDMTDLREMHIRREEQLVAQLMQTGKVELMEYIEDKATGEVVTISYYNPTDWAFALPWNNPAANILADLDAIADERQARGLPSKELVLGSEVCEAIIRNDDIYRLLDNNKFQMGSVAPAELPNGASYVGRIRTYKGREIDLLSYIETYMDDDGVEKPYIAPGKVILGAADMARMNYGSITQMEKDEVLHTYEGAYVPRLTADIETDSRKLRLASAPLPSPNNKLAFSPADVLF